MSRTGSINVAFLFELFEVQRMMRLYADKQVARYGLTRAQWAVLAKLDRTEGLKQTEVAELMEMQPITLTRLIDKLCDAGLIERRNDEHDRRVNRLYLTKASRPMMAKLSALRHDITETALASIGTADRHRLVQQLETIKHNVRDAMQGATADAKISITKLKEQQYG